MQYKRRPPWLKYQLSKSPAYRQVRELITDEKLHTVCQSARCPNVGECWSQGTATFMILGNICTRNCRFCAVGKGDPQPPDPYEPERIAAAVKRLDLKHVVITSVTRDDLPDGGSSLFADTIRQIRGNVFGCTVEVLIPDFQGNRDALQVVFEAAPDILNHNLEVVPRLYPAIRGCARFDRSFDILTSAKGHGLVVKTGIMVGLGETKKELFSLFRPLARINLDILTIGQYLQPTFHQLHPKKYYHPDEFLRLKETAESFGIRHVESGPLVRSSYHAAEQVSHLNQPVV